MTLNSRLSSRHSYSARAGAATGVKTRHRRVPTGLDRRRNATRSCKLRAEPLDGPMWSPVEMTAECVTLQSVEARSFVAALRPSSNGPWPFATRKLVS